MTKFSLFQEYWFNLRKSIKIIDDSSRRKGKYHMIILMDSEKVLDFSKPIRSKNFKQTK